MVRSCKTTTLTMLPMGHRRAAKRYTTDHEWISFDDATQMGTIGITEYAQKALGDVVYVELPTLATVINAGGTFITPYTAALHR